MMLLGLFVLTSLSCERDEFLVDNYVENGVPVNVVIGFELPQKDELATTRTLTDKDEHYVGDFYLLIFNADKERIFGKYYSNDELRDKVSYAKSQLHPWMGNCQSCYWNVLHLWLCQYRCSS